MIEKGFKQPTSRVQKLKKQIVDAKPRVESDRVLLVTEAYKETEGLSAVLRRAKVAEKLFLKMPVTIRDHELVVGSLTKTSRSTGLCPEFSYEWVAKEFETMGTRMADPFEIPKETVSELEEAFRYWKGKTTSDLADSYMSEEAKTYISSGIFTVGNYFYGGVGHICVDYGKILKEGFRGILAEVESAKRNLDKMDSDYIKKSQYYEATRITYEAAIQFAKRYANHAKELASREVNPIRKEELEKIAKNCCRVPEYGATNFYEACQSFWFIQLMVQMESNGHSISPGRFDQYMYPYYQMDTSITLKAAQELIDCIWVKLNDLNKTRDEVSAQAFAGYQVFQNLCVGGQDAEGRDATNEISYMCMESAANVALPAPSFSIRVWQGTPDEFLLRACEVVRLGLGVPAMYNDEVIIPSLVNRGVSLEDARNYCIIGCVEPQVPNKTEGWHDAAFFNVAKILEITLNNGKVGTQQLGPITGELTSFTSIEDLFTAFQKQMAHFVYYLADACNSVDLAHAERAPLPFLSAMVDDCIGRGKTVQEGGAIYNFTGPQAFGVADTGDSVYAIQKNVFEDRKLTLTELKEALACNFGHEEATTSETTPPLNDELEAQIYEIVKQMLTNSQSIDLNEVYTKLAAKNLTPQAKTSQLNKNNFEHIRRMLDNTPSFGNDHDEVDFIARRCAKIYCLEVEKYRNPRGGQFQAGIYPVSANVLFGKDVQALPNGRLAKKPLADGVSPRAGKDSNGPTAAANSVAKLDHFIASNGTLYNQKFLPSAVAGDKGLLNFSALVRSYFDRKGMHVQFNVIDKETLIKAQKNPEDYKDLVVRVAGYSAHFVVLAKEVQDDIINRTEHSL